MQASDAGADRIRIAAKGGADAVVEISPSLEATSSLR
jgi:hypothetical protein